MPRLHGRRRYSTVAALPRIFSLTSLDSTVLGCIEHCEAQLALVRKPQKKTNMHAAVSILDSVSNNLCSLIDCAEAIVRLRPGTAFAAGASEASRKVFQYMAELNADRAIYDSLVECLAHDEQEERGGPFLCKEGRRVGQALRKDFEASGIHLSPSERAELVKTHTELQRLGTAFETATANDALTRLLELIQQRGRLARLLGFTSYADLVLRDHVLGSARSVQTFLDMIQPNLGGDASVLGRGHTRSPADQLTGLDLRTCLQLLAPLCSRYFNVEFDIKLVEVWNMWWWRLQFSDAGSRDASGEVYVCADHRLTNCHFVLRTWRDQSTKNSVYGTKGIQRPISMVTINVADPRSLSFGEIQSLFHEFGHALHSICARTRFHHLSGTRCTLDFAEVPSNLMEQILLHAKGVLSKATKDARLLSRFQAWQRSVIEGERGALARQLALARLDQFLHGSAPMRCPDRAGFEALLTEWARENIQLASEQQVLLSGMGTFRHLVTYGAAYYCYLFSQSLAREIWSRYLDYGSKQHSPLAFHQRALRYGGSRSTAEILAELRIDWRDLINR